MIAWGFVGIRIVLPARLKLPIPGSRFWSFGCEIHFDLFEWSCIFTCLGFDGFWLCFGMVEKTKIVHFRFWLLGRRRHAPSTRLLDARAAARATKEAEAEEASAVKKAAEEASITRVTEAVIAVQFIMINENQVEILWSSGKGQARTGKGWPLRQKALKLKPFPIAYIKVGCHHHPPPSLNERLDEPVRVQVR